MGHQDHHHHCQHCGAHFDSQIELEKHGVSCHVQQASNVTSTSEDSKAEASGRSRQNRVFTRRHKE